jgi:hypothetical protein
MTSRQDAPEKISAVPFVVRRRLCPARCTLLKLGYAPSTVVLSKKMAGLAKPKAKPTFQYDDLRRGRATASQQVAKPKPNIGLVTFNVKQCSSICVLA